MFNNPPPNLPSQNLKPPTPAPATPPLPSQPANPPEDILGEIEPVGESALRPSPRMAPSTPSLARKAPPPPGLPQATFGAAQGVPPENLERVASRNNIEPLAALPVNLSEPEDILSEVDRSESKVKRPDGAVASPGRGGIPPTAPEFPASPLPPPSPQFEEEKSGRGKKLMIGLAIFGCLAVIVATAGLLFWQWLNGGFPFKANLKSAVTNQPVNQTPATNQVVQPLPQVTVDSDQDGLTDDEEALYGTDPNSVDSDQDELFDRDEVKVFGTDPLNKDTDGDGYDDFTEITNHFNPKGSGKLQ